MTLITKLGRESVRKLCEKICDMCLVGSQLNLELGRIRLAITNVFRDGPIKQQRFLCHNANLSSQNTGIHLSEVNSINPDHPGMGIEKSGKQIHQRRFTATIFTDDSNRGTEWNDDLNVVQNFSTRLCGIELGIVKCHPIKLDRLSMAG